MAEDEVLTEDGAEETHAPNDAVILSYSQMPVNYNAVPKVWLTHPDSTEEAPVLVPFTYGEAMSKTVEPDFSNGDMAIEVPEGELITELAIIKPENLKPENISKDVEIAGVIGNLEGGDTEEVAVDLNMADGDQIVTPTETGKSMSKVTVKKPDTLIPGNIAAGVDIAGIIGSLVAGGGGGASDLKVKFGTFTTAAITSTGVRISADIGFKPGFLFIQANVAAVTNNKANVYFGIGSTFADAHGLTLFNSIVYRGTSAMTYYTYTYSINSSTASAPIYNASATGFNLGVRAPKESTEFFYIAIADPT
jgi:hypothetical protein